MDRIENDTSNDSSVIEHVFVAMVTFLASRFPTEPLPTNDGDTRTDT
jgi:hypothetical protein